MDYLTNDLRSLVLSGEVNEHQARAMMNSRVDRGTRRKSKKPSKKKQWTPDLPEQALCVSAVGVGTGEVGQLPDDIYAILLSFCNVKSLVLLGSTCKFLSSLALNDALWERLYLQRWKRPKPPAPGANCPRHHLSFYQLYARRIILSAIRGHMGTLELINEEPPTESKGAEPGGKPASRAGQNKGKLSNAHALVAVRHVGDNHIVSAGVDGLIKSWDLTSVKCVMSLDSKDAFVYQDKQIGFEKRIGSLGHAWKNKLINFKIGSKAASPKAPEKSRPTAPGPSPEQKLRRNSGDGKDTVAWSSRDEEVEIDIWGDSVSTTAGASEELGRKDLGLKSPKTPKRELGTPSSTPIKIPSPQEEQRSYSNPVPSPVNEIKGFNENMALLESDTDTEDGNSSESSMGSSLDSGGVGFTVGSFGSSPGGLSGFLTSSQDCGGSNNFAGMSTKKRARELKKQEKRNKKLARKQSAKEKMKAKERIKLERQQKSKEAMKKREAAASSKKMSGLARVISDKPPFTRSPGSVDSYSIKSIMPSSILRGKNHKCRPESKIPHKGLSLLGSSPIECSMLKHSKPAVLTRAMSSPSPASSPPLSPSSLAHRPDGGMLIRSNSMDSLVLGGQSPAAGKRKKKGGRKKRKHRNAWQQSREDRARKSREEMEERLSKQSQGSNSSGSEAGNSDHESQANASDGTVGVKCPIMFVSRERLSKAENGSKILPRIVAVFQNSQVVTFTAPVKSYSSSRGANEDDGTEKEAVQPVANKNEMMNTIVMPRVLSRPRWVRAEHWVIQCVALTFDGRIVLGHSGDGQVGTASLSIWDGKSGKQLHTLYGLKGAPSCLAAVDCQITSNTYSYVFCGDSVGDVTLWNTSEGNMVCALPAPVKSETKQAGNKGRIVVSMKATVARVTNSFVTTVIAGFMDGRVVVWHADSSEGNPDVSVHVRGSFAYGSLSAVRAIAAASWQRPYVRMIAFGRDDSTIQLWELPLLPQSNALELQDAPASKQSSGWKKVLKGHEGAITALKIDLTKVTSASMDGTVKLWEVVGKHAGRCLRTLRHPGSTQARVIPALSLSVGSLGVTVGYLDGSLHVFGFGKKAKHILVEAKAESSSNGQLSYTNRKGGVSPRRSANASKKYASGGKRRSLRDLQAKCRNLEVLNKQLGHCFEFDDEEL
jgi:hypothetical protein